MGGKINNLIYYGLIAYLIDVDTKESFRVLSDYVKKPEDWIAHLALGEYYIKENQPEKVVEHFQKVFEFSPENWRNYALYLYVSNKIIFEVQDTEIREDLISLKLTRGNKY